MSTINPREMFGDEYRLTILENGVAAPPATEKMFRIVLDELGLKGNFNFHPKGRLPQSAPDAKPRMSAVLGGSEILVSMRWGTQENDSVSGSLFVPSGHRPAEVQQRLVKLLGDLNADGWSELQLNGAAEPSSAFPSVQPHAPAAASAPTVPPAAMPADKDEAIARDLFKKVGRNAVIKGYCIRDYLQRHHPEPGNRLLVKNTIARLEGEGVLRRVTLEDQGEWQFTEAYLKEHGLEVSGYHPLQKVAPKMNGGHPSAQTVEPQARPSSPPGTASSEVAGTQVPPSSSVSPEDPEEETALPVLGELRQLYADFGCLLEERPQVLARVDEAQRALVELDASMDAKKTQIDAIKATISKDDLLRFVLQRSTL